MSDIDGEHGCEARLPVNNLKSSLFLTQSHHMISDDLEYNIIMFFIMLFAHWQLWSPPNFIICKKSFWTFFKTSPFVVDWRKKVTGLEQHEDK